MLNLVAVGKSFKGPSGEKVPVLNDIHLKVEAGEMVAVMGPSGSGKSTLLNIIGGLLQYDTGSVAFYDRELASLTKSEKDKLRNQQIGFIFQGSQILGALNLVDNVMLPVFFDRGKIDNWEIPKSKAIKLLQQLGLKQKLNYFPHQLSLGQKRRVAIARALINNPDLILADEPTSDLDPPRVKQVISILKVLTREGRAMIVATHDMKVAEAADRCYNISDGLLKEEFI